MQRSITNQKPVESILYVLLFAAYESLSSIYLFLPPLFGVLFVLFLKSLKNEDMFSLLFISLCLVLFEADRGYMLFSSVIFFALSYKFLIPRLIQNISCQSCIMFLYVIVAYVGFSFFQCYYLVYF